MSQVVGKDASIYEVVRIPKPAFRPLKVYAFDPSAGHYVGNRMTVRVTYEPLAPGPVGERLAVVDYDYSQKTYYLPVNLDDLRLVMPGGLEPNEGDPRFHQQMVYAVASEILQRFENALGRRIRWARAAKMKSGRNQSKLFLFPHAMVGANAFYSRAVQGIVFGYFRASKTDPGANLPGQVVFTCLSHDIIAHEMTHAIVDGIRHYFMEPTNVDVVAFHEAFADISALFCHFSHKDVLLDSLQRTGGKLYEKNYGPEAGPDTSTPEPTKATIQAQLSKANPLLGLALQFGEASGMRSALRSALGTPPDPNDLATKTEPHERGSILVAAVFDAYFSIYTRRTADLFRIFRAGSGGTNPVDLPQSLAGRLAEEASRTAEEFFTICARALDYCPPVDIVFGDFLRALLTAHADLYPGDPDGVRNAFMEAFRLRGIVPQDASFFSENALLWPQVDADALDPVEGLTFGDPNGLTDQEKNDNGSVLRAYAKEHAKKLGFPDDHGPIDAPSFHPMFRIGPQGDLIVDMVVELVETCPLDADNPEGVPFRGGVTLLIWQEALVKGKRPPPRIHYVIPKHRDADRATRQRMYSARLTGALDDHDHDHDDQRSPKAAKPVPMRIDFGLIHAGL
jgi:hypothetical protein